ncbi:MAG: hypothetical protein AAFR21_12175 [Pseudomonadota bacterium]
MNSKRPALHIWAVALTALMTYRLLPLVSYGDLGDSVPISWVNPFTGDILIGLTAPIMAFLLARRQTLFVWTVAIVWHALGIWDYCTGIILDFVDPITWAPPGALELLVAGVLIQLLNVYILTRPRMIQAYIGNRR